VEFFLLRAAVRLTSLPFASVCLVRLSQPFFSYNSSNFLYSFSAFSASAFLNFALSSASFLS
jgi:hypothetical protein